MKYTVVVSDTAYETFNSIKEQIRNKWGDQSVTDFDARTLKALKIIRFSPQMYQSINSNPGVRRGVIHKNCSVYYEIREFHIEILFFWDNRQDPIFL